MLKFIFALTALLITLQTLQAQVYVRGYYRKDGTYVQPHYRSEPDGNPYNNWSFPGNVNPYTGKKAKGNPDTYLRNYYNREERQNNYHYHSPYSPQENYFYQEEEDDDENLFGTW